MQHKPIHTPKRQTADTGNHRKLLPGTLRGIQANAIPSEYVSNSLLCSSLFHDKEQDSYKNHLYAVRGFRLAFGGLVQSKQLSPFGRKPLKSIKKHANHNKPFKFWFGDLKTIKRHSKYYKNLQKPSKSNQKQLKPLGIVWRPRPMYVIMPRGRPGTVLCLFGNDS